MGIQVGDNFDHKSKKPLDARTSYATLALMKAVTDANIYEGCEAYCAETDKYYKFLSTNTVDATTGKWREREGGGGEDCYKTGDSVETDIDDDDYFPFYDTSSSASRKTMWSNIKSALTTFFATTFQRKIYDSYSATIDANYKIHASASEFGTSEAIVGTWLNGERLYQRTYTGTFPSSAGDVTLFSVSGLNLKDVTGYCLWRSGDTNFFKLPSSYVYNGNRSDCCFYVYNGNLVAGVTDGNSYIKGRPYVITIRYTK